MRPFCLGTQVYKQAGDCRDITNNLVVAHAEFHSVEVSGARSSPGRLVVGQRRVVKGNAVSRMNSVKSRARCCVG